MAKQQQRKLNISVVQDFRRSGGNVKVVVYECVILPRATDVVADALDLMEATSSPQCEFMVLDFKDAFK